MTNEEALAHFKNHEYMTDFSWQDEMSEVAISAIEKQIPKKPIITKFDNGAELINCGVCVMCSHITRAVDYCPHCGQRIDWTEGEEA